MLKKGLYILIFALSQFVISQNEQKFIDGNNYYNEGEYQEAIINYEAIIESGQHSAELYFNLANAYYKTNQIAPSIYYYEKALRLSPNDKDIQNNLSFAQNMTIDSIDDLPEAGFARTINSVTNSMSFDTWATVSVSLMILFVILFLAYYFSYQTNKKRLMFLSSFVSLGLAMIALTFAFQKFGIDQNDNPAIVFAQKAEVKTEPNLRSESAFDLHEGTKVQVLENYSDDWVKIKLSDGKTGWVASTDIKAL